MSDLGSVSNAELISRVNRIVSSEIDDLLKRAMPLVQKIAVLRREAQAIYDELKKRGVPLDDTTAQREDLQPTDQPR